MLLGGFYVRPKKQMVPYEIHQLIEGVLKSVMENVMLALLKV